MWSHPPSGRPAMMLRWMCWRNMLGAAGPSWRSVLVQVVFGFVGVCCVGGDTRDASARYAQSDSHSARSNSLVYGSAFLVMLRVLTWLRENGVRSLRNGTAA